MKRKYKSQREKGKIKLSMMFQKLAIGDKVSINRELGQPASFPKRILGRTGVIEEKRGHAYVIKVQEYDAEKRYIIQPVHLKKIVEKTKEKKK